MARVDARRAWRGVALLAATVCALVAILPAVPARATRVEGPLPWRMGGRVGFSLDALCVPDSTGEVLELAVRIPVATLRLLSRDESGDAHLRLNAHVRCHGAQKLDAEQAMTIAAADSSPAFGKLAVLRFPARPGPCRITVRVTDVLSRKPGIFVSNEGLNESAEIDGEAPLPAAQAGRELSDVEFLWPARAEAAAATIVRAGRAALPNPERLYGLMASELRARFVAYGKPDSPPRPWHWVARVFDAHGEGVAQRESTAAASHGLDEVTSFDLSPEPAGAYELEIKAWQEGDAGALHRRARFSVGWRPETWVRNAADVEDEIHFLLSSSEEDDWSSMLPGAQEKMLQEFWSRRDPSPETAQNENYDTFRERVRHANETFGAFRGQKGMFTDMGRVYIRYGPPSEVQKQVIPTGYETLNEVLQQIANSEKRLPEGIESTGPGGDLRPYEVWIYEGQIPMPLDVDPHESNRGRMPHKLVFLFVDEQGLGLYRLRYSTE